MQKSHVHKVAKLLLLHYSGQYHQNFVCLWPGIVEMAAKCGQSFEGAGKT